MSCFLKCMLQLKITWHQTVARRPGARLFICRAVFWPSITSMSALNKTYLAPSHAGLWGEFVSFLRRWEMLQWRRRAPELGSSWADILSRDVEGKGHFAWVVHHYGYLPACFCVILAFLPVDSLSSDNVNKWILLLALEQHLQVKMPQTLSIDLEKETKLLRCGI